MTQPSIALALHAQLGSPLRGAGPCLAFVMHLEDLLARFVVQVQAAQRQGQLLDQPANLLARELLKEVVIPGSGREIDCPEIW